ncbi:MAG: P-loop NTPase [Planctomycetes bacterium]|nr:P-loop NTPase [Planctomycetota bacterium]
MDPGVIEEFLREVDRGARDLLVVDSPPGTGDEPLSVCRLLDRLDGAIVENMSGFVCPRCGEVTEICRRGLGGRPVVREDRREDPRAGSRRLRRRGSMKEDVMRIAIPVADGRLAMHFGHCEAFALVDVDPEAKTILGTRVVPAPPHQPGLLPRWLAEQSAKIVIAGGMGMRAQSLFADNGIDVIVGAPFDTPERIVAGYLEGTLAPGDNLCDH